MGQLYGYLSIRPSGELRAWASDCCTQRYRFRTRQHSGVPSLNKASSIGMWMVLQTNQTASVESSALMNSCQYPSRKSNTAKYRENMPNRRNSYNPIYGQFIQTPEVHAKPAVSVHLPYKHNPRFRISITACVVACVTTLILTHPGMGGGIQSFIMYKWPGTRALLIPIVRHATLVASARSSVPPRFHLDGCKLFRRLCPFCSSGHSPLNLICSPATETWPVAPRSIPVPDEPGASHSTGQFISPTETRNEAPTAYLRRTGQTETGGATLRQVPERPDPATAAGRPPGGRPVCRTPLQELSPRRVVHLPRAFSIRIQGRLRPTSEASLQRPELTPADLQTNSLRNLLEVLQEGPNVPIFKELWPWDLYRYPGYGTQLNEDGLRRGAIY
ncbi:hypothetical protein CSKR_111117 [Clonorchis sinensis]|uniref:Uncharacterized protein n=1 Tax=Clonorchis sinensis TaxID=79923 RepID=A0A419Q384_CLOSI|nr:hypothetical protein CSKR_111117 [Clonorchis sinensis]